MNKYVFNTIISIIILSILVSCQKERKTDYITVSGTIENPIEDQKITIQANSIDLTYKKSSYKKIINVDEKGYFLDTLKLHEREYDLIYGDYTNSIHLKNGFNLTIKFDTKKPVESVEYLGFGYERNQLNADKKRLNKQIIETYTENEIDHFDIFIKTTVLDKHNALLDSYKGKIADSFLIKKKEQINRLYSNTTFLKKYLKKLKSEKAKKELYNSIAQNFSYLDKNSNNIRLSDFKGSYVYIDIWATWCQPCIFQEPYFKKMYQKYKGKNIEFISISIDIPEDRNKWLRHVQDRQLAGIQLFENQGGQSIFIKSLNHNTIPRYLLIDPDGKIIDSDAPKPSSEKKIMRLFGNIAI